MEIYLEFAENKAIGAKRQGQQEESISSNALNKKTLQPKMAQIMLLFRHSTLRIARAATVIDRFVILL